MNVILWFVGTMAAGISGYFMLATGADRYFGGLPVILIVGLMLAIPIALGQWAMLDGRIPDAGVWLLAVPSGGAAGVLAGMAAAGGVMSGGATYDGLTTFLVAPAAAGAVGGTVSGSITGLALVWFVRPGVAPD
jgi:hypothetical protein